MDGTRGSSAAQLSQLLGTWAGFIMPSSLQAPTGESFGEVGRVRASSPRWLDTERMALRLGHVR